MNTTETRRWPGQPDASGQVLDKGYDFWVESETTGALNSRTYMDGKLLHGVRSVETHTDGHDATTVTITFIARTLNKGARPSEGSDDGS